MTKFYHPSDEVIVKIYNCNDLNTKKALVLEQLDKMACKSGKNFKNIHTRVAKATNLHTIDQAFTNLILVDEGLKVF